jgi:glyoxalase family protein
MHLLGLHHVSAITASRQECLDFYGALLGLQAAAEPGAGSLAFTADTTGGGGVLSFVVSPEAAAGDAGRGLVHRLQWSVSGPAALESWRRRLDSAGVSVTAWLNGAGHPLALRFRDPDGLEHEMAIALGAQSLTLAGVRAYAAASVQSGDLLAGRLGFESCGEGAWVVGTAPDSARYDCDPPPPSRPVQGAGTVRHVAWACRPGEERAWRQRVIGMGATVSRVIECEGYRCFFFREPDGVLFGVATRNALVGGTQPRFQLPQPAEIPARIARPIGILAAA